MTDMNTTDAPTLASPAPAVPAERIEALAHRIAWRYKKSTDTHHSDTYTFNRTTLLQFAQAIATPQEAPAPRAVPDADEWEVYNTGAQVASGLTLTDALDYLTPARLDRGWSVVCVINKDNAQKFAGITAPTAAPHPAQEGR